MMDYFELKARREWQKSAEADGRVADSMEVRLKLMERVNSGEITLEHAQAEIARFKRGAKAAGKITRNQAYLGR
jgi:hypothetical protein